MGNYYISECSNVGLFGTHITENGLKNIQKYNYKSGGSTFLDLKMNPFWEIFTSFIPEYISPNLLTVMGFLSSLLAVVIILTYSPTLDTPISPYVSLIIALLLFLYQTLDAADGKHARNLNLSSPLGQLLDHGLDSYTTVFFPTIFCALVRMGWNYKFIIMLTITQLKMMSFIWLECHCKVFRCSSSEYLGVTESQFFVIFFATFSAFNINEFLFKKFIFNISYLDFVVFTITSIGILTLINDTIMGLNECKNLNVKKIASLEICGALCHVLFQFLFLFSNIYLNYPKLSLYIITTSSSIVVLRMNVSSFTIEELPYIHWPLLPFYLCSVLLIFGNILIHNFSEFKLIILIFISLWNTLYTLDFTIVVVKSICFQLKISLFSTRKLRNEHCSKRNSFDKNLILEKNNLTLKDNNFQNSQELKPYSISRSCIKKSLNRHY